MFSKTDCQREYEGERALAWTGRFCVIADVAGTLCIRPLCKTLDPGELAVALAAINQPAVLDGLSDVVFDLGGVETITPGWTLVMAMLINFARHTNVACHVVGLRGQPAAVAFIYRRNPELMRLISCGPTGATAAA